MIEGINGFGVVNLGKVTPNFYLNLKVLEENGKLLEDKKIMMEALQIMKTGDYKAPESKISMEVVAGKVQKI